MNLDSILKSRDITLPTKFHLVKAMVFPVVKYGCESWTVKKAECQRIDAFELWCWTLESPLDCREIQPVHPEGNQSWIFIGRTDTEAETPIVWSPDVKNRFIWKDPDAGKDWRWEEKGDDRGWDGWMTSPTRWTWVCAGSRVWWWTGKPGVLQTMGSQRVGHNWVTELNWNLCHLSLPFTDSVSRAKIANSQDSPKNGHRSNTSRAAVRIKSAVYGRWAPCN